MSNEDNNDDFDFKQFTEMITCTKCGKKYSKYNQFLHNTLCGNTSDSQSKQEEQSIPQNSEIKDKSQDNAQESKSSLAKTDLDEYIKFYQEKIRKMKEGNTLITSHTESKVIQTSTKESKDHELNLSNSDRGLEGDKIDQKTEDKKSDISSEDIGNHSDSGAEEILNPKQVKFEEKIVFSPNEKTIEILTERAEEIKYNPPVYSDVLNNRKFSKTGNFGGLHEDSFETEFNKEIVDELASKNDEFFIKTNLEDEAETYVPEKRFKETNFTKESEENVEVPEETKLNTLTPQINLNQQNKETGILPSTMVNKAVTNKDESKPVFKPQKILNNKKGPNNTQQSPKKQAIVPSELIEKIEKAGAINNVETKKQQEELQSIEAALPLDQRLIHEKWQIRKNAFKVVANMIEFLHSQHEGEYDPNSDTELSQAFDTFSPWMVYFLTDSNITTLSEGLQTFYIFMRMCEKYRHKALFQFLDEMERIFSFNKPNIFELCDKILEVFLKDKKLKNLTVNEILKKMVVKNNKQLSFLSDFIIKNFKELNESYVKLIFEKAILHFSNTESKNPERKKSLLKVITELFKKIADSFEAVRKNNSSINSEVAKELQKFLSKCEKENPGIRLYKYMEESVQETNELKGSQNHNSNANKYNNTQMKLEKPLKNEDVDLLTLLPDNFKDFTYIAQINKKTEVLKAVGTKLAGIKSLAIKDYKMFYDTLDYAIGDTNVLVHLEAIKILTSICALLQMQINYPKLKVLLYSCFDKFSDNKTNVKNQLFILFDTILFNFCMQIENFLDFTLQFILKQKNTNIKSNIAEYLKSLLDENPKEEGRNMYFIT